MDERIKATFLVNAAVLIEYEGIKFLLDGIYDENGHHFSNLSEAQWDSLCNGKGEYSNIDYLLFTHEHGDHFSPERTREYLDFQKPKAVFLPKEGSTELVKLEEKIEALQIPCALLEKEFCKKTIFRPEKRIQLKIFQTRHLDKIYWKVPHFCYLMELGDKKLLFTADVDFTQEEFDELKDIKLDGIFINPLMNHSKEGKKLFADGVLQAKRKVVYHIPYEEDDFMKIRNIAERDRQADVSDAVYLMKPGQVFYF